jgi:hypothetical protein
MSVVPGINEAPHMLAEIREEIRRLLVQHEASQYQESKFSRRAREAQQYRIGVKDCLAIIDRAFKK